MDFMFQFRDVVRPIEFQYETFLNKENVSYERLVPKAKGVFYNEKIPLQDEDKEKYLQNLLNEKAQEDTGEDSNTRKDWEICVDAINSLLRKHNDGRVYFRDLDSEMFRSISVLTSFTSHITVNESNTEMPGINLPMHYVGGKFSYTAHHEEDGGLSSINILKAGEPKVWFIISHKFRAELEREVFEYLKEKFPNKGKNGKNVCFHVMKHKIYFITPLLLDEWKIPYTFVLQKPGDLFYIRRGTYHAVINLGKNLAEAINYGCDEWVSEYEPSVCDCKEGSKNNVEQDHRVAVIRKKLKKLLLVCNVDGCQNIFSSQRKLKMHINKVHKNNKEQLFSCDNCSKTFEQKSSLANHMRTHLPSTSGEPCNKCGKLVLDLKRHEKRNHGGKQNVRNAKSHLTYWP